MYINKPGYSIRELMAKNNLKPFTGHLIYRKNYIFFGGIKYIFFAITIMSFLPMSLSAYQTSDTVYTQSGGTATETNQSYISTTSDKSGVFVTNSGTLTLTNSSVKTSGNTTSSDSSSFYGLNAGVLASNKGIIYLTGCSITTTGTGANGVFATGSGSSITLVNDTINCSNNLGHGVDATNGAVLTLTDVIINTAGGSSAAIATDRGGGTINVTGGTFKTTGTTAPGIYSTGTISISGADISATGSEGAVIEGANSITLTNTKLSGAVKRGVMIYQSMSGDASGTEGIFTMTGGSFSSVEGPLFYVTNSTGIIKITGVTTNIQSGVLINAGADQWGTTGSNGGTVIFTADSENLSGNITCDSYSSVTATFQNSSTLKGYINTAALTLDASSTWNVTADSYLTSLTETGGTTSSALTNITDNGYTIYYNKSLSANSWLGGSTYTLSGGGKLTPATTTAVNESTTTPAAFALNQNYPNPFNPTTIISYQLPVSGFISLKVYDILGKEVSILTNGYKPAGKYTVTFNASGLASGIYIYKLNSGNYSSIKKMMVLK
jgi:hypothetical protein